MRAMAILFGFLGPLAALPARAQTVIDDFETGPFYVAASTAGVPSAAAPAVSVPAHAITGTRQVLIFPGDDGPPAMYATVFAGSQVDDVLEIFFNSGGSEAQLIYDPTFTTMDLSGGGVNDRVEVQVADATPGAGIQMKVWDAVGGYATFGMGVTAGTLRFWFADLAPVDFSQVTRLDFDLVHFIPGTIRLSDIRAMREDTRWLRYEIPAEIASGPPFPIHPFLFTVLDKVPSDHQSMRLLNAIQSGSGAPAPLLLTVMDSGGDADAGLMGGIGMSWNDAGVPVAATDFELRVDVDALSGIDPPPFMTMLPSITPSSTGFMLAFEVFHPGVAGGAGRITERRVLVDALPGQDLDFENIQVQAVAGARSAAHATGGELPASFVVTFEMKPVDVDPGEPLFEIATSGTCRPASTTSADPAPSAAPQALAAWPSVTRAGTELRLARPAAAPGRIDLIDAAGRRVRRFEIVAGESVRHWDGRDMGGSPTPAGIYFARFVAPGVVLTTRIVRLP